jgi:hypothetical protein
MRNKIVYFPLVAESRAERIKAYRPTTRAETAIAIWLCGWAMVTAGECIRQVSKLPIAAAPPAHLTYVALTHAGQSNPCRRQSCNFSQADCVL